MKQIGTSRTGRTSAVLYQGIEFLLLGLATPFLLFPSREPKATVAVLALLVVLWLGSLPWRRPWPVTPFNGALLLFTVMVGVGSIVTAYPDLTLSKATGFILGMGLFRWAAGMRRRTALVLALAAFLLAALGVWGLGLMGTAWLSKVSALQTLLDRLPEQVVSLPGTPERGINPNQLGGVLALLLPLPVALALMGHFTWRSLPLRLFLGGLAVAWGGTLLLTQSRSGWMGGAVGLVALAALWGLSGQQRWQRWAGAAFLFLVTMGAGALLTHWGPGRVGELLASATQGHVDSPVGTITIQGRLEIWSRALYAILDFPFTGCGLGTFRRTVWVLYPFFSLSPGFDVAHAHNIFLQTALDLGLPGLVAYLALLGLAGVAGWRVARRSKETRWLGLGMLAGLVGLHVYGLTDALALGSRPHFLFWWMLGLLAAAL